MDSAAALRYPRDWMDQQGEDGCTRMTEMTG